MTPQAEQLLARIERDLERDRHNQALIDGMKRLPPHARLAPQIRGANWIMFGAIVFCLALWSALAHADPLTPAPVAASSVPCPTPGQACKILILTPQEEQLLMGQNGVLDTAAQARALDLGQFSVYFKTRIAAAPAGEVVPPLKPAAPAETPPAK